MIKNYLITTVILLISVLTNAQTMLTLSDVSFNEINGTITDYIGTATNIEIPSTFNVGGTDYDVTTIGYNAFYDKNLTGVTIPGSVTSIEIVAFASNALISVIIPSSVTAIGGGAFNRNAIQTLNGQVSNGIMYARNADGSEDNTTIVSYGGVADVIDFIPGSVTTMGNWAFYYNTLTSVVIPNSVTTIGFQAFSYNALTSVVIPSSVTYIGNGAFKVNGLTSFILPTLDGYSSTWSDENSVTYNGGDEVTNLEVAYTQTSITAINYGITYNLYGGTNGTNPDTYTIEDVTIILADASKTDYTFDGWFTTDYYQVGTEISEIAQGSFGDTILYAKFTITTGIADIENASFNIYPNPAYNHIVIANVKQSVESIKILDITGKLVKQMSINKEKSQFDVSNLKEGIYFLKIDNQVMKFIKE